MGIQTNDEQNTTEENTIRDRCALFESKATSQFSSSKPVVGRMMQQKPVQTGRAQPALSITKKAVKKVVIKTEQQADGKTTSQSKTISQTSSSKPQPALPTDKKAAENFVTKTEAKDIRKKLEEKKKALLMLTNKLDTKIKDDIQLLFEISEYQLKINEKINKNELIRSKYDLLLKESVDEYNKLCEILQQKYEEIERLEKENQNDKVISSIKMLVNEYKTLYIEFEKKDEALKMLSKTRDTAINNYNKSVKKYNNNNETYYKALMLIIQALLEQQQIDYTEATKLISEIKGLFTELEEEQKKQSLNLK